jgi:hypothetical protein
MPADANLNLLWKFFLPEKLVCNMNLKVYSLLLYFVDMDQITDSAVICSQHFTADSFVPKIKQRKLGKGAIPSLFNVC